MRWVAGRPSSGKRWVNESMTGAACQDGSSRMPSQRMGPPVRTASAVGTGSGSRGGQDGESEKGGSGMLESLHARRWSGMNPRYGGSGTVSKSLGQGMPLTLVRDRNRCTDR